MRISLWRFVPAALLPLLASGCLPNATWLPDSSGFVYTGGPHKDSLYLYDLDKKAARTLVEKGAGPAWPAVSPDGKRIAVVSRSASTGVPFVTSGGDSLSLKVIVFDRDGKELNHSPPLKWLESNRGDALAAQAFWVPGQDKLLLECDGVSGFYDLKTKSSTLLDVTLCTYRNTPIRPDGKGFVASAKSGDKGLVFVDWDGKNHDIRPTSKDAFDNHSGDVLGGMLMFPLMHSSHWDGSKAVVRWDDLQVTTDADKLTTELEVIKPATSADGNVIQDEVKLAGGAVVRAVELKKRYKDGKLSNEETSYRVEVQKPGAKEPKTLMDGAGYFMLYPSPDGKKAVAKCSRSLDAVFKTSNSGEDELFVIDDKGDVTDTIDLAK